MLFRANLPHPAFVDQAIGAHGQSGIPDMLEMLLVVQFIQIALHGSVGRTGQLHRIGKNPVMGLFAAEFPCVVGLRVFEQHVRSRKQNVPEGRDSHNSSLSSGWSRRAASRSILMSKEKSL